MEAELWKRRIFGNLESIKSRQCNIICLDYSVHCSSSVSTLFSTFLESSVL